MTSFLFLQKDRALIMFAKFINVNGSYQNNLVHGVQVAINSIYWQIEKARNNKVKRVAIEWDFCLNECKLAIPQTAYSC